MSKEIRWGIMGPGGIADAFAKALEVIPTAKLTAVASKSQERADVFGEKHKVAKRFSDYKRLAEDPEVDAVYIATLHPAHHQCMLTALNAGKAVLCEKPFTLNVKEAEEAIALARSKKVFLMEAMWTRFLPASAKVREWIKNGEIGEVRMATTNVGFRSGWDPTARDLCLELGGGALLDMGVYNLAYMSMILGTPKEIKGFAHIGETKVDEQLVAILNYDKGALGHISTAVQTRIPAEAVIHGTTGEIRVPAFWNAKKAILTVGRQVKEEFEAPWTGNGYNYEVEEAMRLMGEGKLESDLMPLSETISVMKTMDELRKQWGLVYPQEK